jgi:hypothetical protein
LTPPPKNRKLAPCTRAPVRTVKFQPECPIATVCALSRAIQIVSGQPGRLPEPRFPELLVTFWPLLACCAPVVCVCTRSAAAGVVVHTHAQPGAHSVHTPRAHMKTTSCTCVPVRAVVFQPEWSTATVCAFSRATQIVSGQLGRLPEPRRRSVAPGFAHSWLAGCTPPVGARAHTPVGAHHRAHGCTRRCVHTPCAHENNVVHVCARASRRVSAGATNCNCVRVE